MARRLLIGRAGSAGAAVGRLLWVEPVESAEAAPGGDRALDADVEAARLRDALAAAAAELDDLARETAGRAGEEVGAIFEAQALFARDPGIVDPALAAVAAGASALEAIDRIAAEQADLLAGVDDAYFRERAADLRDVGRRVADLLSGRTRPVLHRRDGQTAILAADDLDPSLVAAIRPELVGGIALVGGAPSGHAAIVARALGIPLVLGFGASLAPDLDGCAALLDGDGGRLVVEPADDDLASLSGPRGSGQADQAPLDSARAAVSPPNRLGILVEANVGSIAEAELAARAGADGIGLVRTELLFLGRTVAPGLAEQRAIYRRIVDAMGDRPVTFRTLDVGGDKPAGFEPTAAEANPALGVRGLRLGLRREALFETQVRAILEASPERPARILLPMVSSLEELRAARIAIEGAADRARADGAHVSSDVRIGVMVEVPALALVADLIAPEVDFFSIGTNDLIQYTLAADRTNPELAELATPLQPAIIRLIGTTCRAAAANGRAVAVCGEAAADPDAASLFVGLGVGELSVAPRAIAAVHAALAGLDPGAARRAAIAAEMASTVAAVREIASGLRNAGSVETRIAG
ncbi:MAG TPA: phosphoenolpyruvate--protein phosphotransferase [Candidatus Limnocylindrales bacterium]|jgi:phosphocarrier protein FPr